MRRLVVFAVLGVTALLVALAIGLALLDTERLRGPVAALLSEQLGRSVEMEELDLAVFPRPALRVHGLRVAGPTPGARAFLEVEEVRLRLAILPLLLGRVVLRGLELDAPRVRVELDAQGRPLLPTGEPVPTGGPSDRAERGPLAEAESKDAGPAADAPGLALAVDTFLITRGSLEVPPWALEHLELRGRLRSDGSAELTFDAEIPGLARLHNIEVELSNLGGESLSVQVHGEILDGDLAGLMTRLELEQELTGRLEGDFLVALAEGRVSELALELRASELHWVAEELELVGEIRLSAMLEGPWRLDLEGTRIAYGEIFHKPLGVEASLSGQLGEELSPKMSQQVVVTLGPNQLRLELDPVRKRVQIEPVTLRLEPLGELLRTGLESLSGSLQLAAGELQLEPLALIGNAELVEVQLGLQHGTVSVNGPLEARGTRLRAEGLRVGIGGQSLVLSGGYDLSSGLVSIDGSASEVEVEPLFAALLGSSPLSGLMEGRVRLEGPPQLGRLSGSGQLEITDGKIRGFSLMKQALGDLAALPLLVASLRGKDLSRFEEEEFKRLAARFRLRGSQLHMDELTLEYRHAIAELHGTVGVPDGSLDLAGTLVIREEVDAALGDRGQGRERRIPISGITGTLARPRLHLDAGAVAALAAAYSGGDRLQEKLQRRIGREGAEAVGSFLERLLGGRKAEP